SRIDGASGGRAAGRCTDNRIASVVSGVGWARVAGEYVGRDQHGIQSPRRRRQRRGRSSVLSTGNRRLTMLVEVRTHAFDPYEELRRYQARLSGRKDIGATACFVGSMRDMNEGLHVSAM